MQENFKLNQIKQKAGLGLLTTHGNKQIKAPGSCNQSAQHGKPS